MTFRYMHSDELFEVNPNDNIDTSATVTYGQYIPKLERFQIERNKILPNHPPLMYSTLNMQQRQPIVISKVQQFVPKKRENITRVVPTKTNNNNEFRVAPTKTNNKCKLHRQNVTQVAPTKINNNNEFRVAPTKTNNKCKSAHKKNNPIFDKHAHKQAVHTLRKKMNNITALNQCYGVTIKGKRCRLKTITRFCHLHETY